MVKEGPVQKQQGGRTWQRKAVYIVMAKSDERERKREEGRGKKKVGRRKGEKREKTREKL